jgi:hypothetical protein
LLLEKCTRTVKRILNRDGNVVLFELILNQYFLAEKPPKTQKKCLQKAARDSPKSETFNLVSRESEPMMLYGKIL